MKGSYYKKLLGDLNANQDSIFEPCTVLSYDPKTMLASVRATNSKQNRDNVPVLFPSMYLNSGSFHPPAKESTGMLFWGANRQPYLFPAYHLQTALNYSDGTMKPTSSPDRVDPSLSLEGVQGGEHLTRSLGGSYVFLNNLGDVEMGTPNMHRVTLSKIDGMLDVVVERSQVDVGGYRSFNGPVNRKSNEHQFKIQLDDTVPSWLGDSTDTDLVRDILDGASSVFEEKEFSPLFEMQAANVYHGSAKTKSTVDDSDLFLEGILYKKDPTNETIRTQVMAVAISKKGSALLTTEDDRYVTEATIRPGNITFVFTDKNATDPNDRVRTQTFGFQM
jgi:hypothetical protein